MTPAERKATEAVVRAAKRRRKDMPEGRPLKFSESTFGRVVARILREEAKTKEKKSGK